MRWRIKSEAKRILTFVTDCPIIYKNTVETRFDQRLNNKKNGHIKEVLMMEMRLMRVMHRRE